MSKKNRVTIADVAKYAQVSTMTVSRVVNNRGQVSDAMSQHVLKAMQELGYKPNRIARSLVSNQTFKIGVVVPDISSLFFSAILESSEHIFWQHNYHMMLCSTNKNTRREQDILDLFEEDRVDGVLILGTHLNCDQLSHHLRNQRSALVFNGEVDTSIAGQILMDEYNALEKAVNYFISVGRKRLVYVGAQRRTYAMRERQRIFNDLIANSSDDVCGWHLDHENKGLEATLQHHFESHPETNGILCFNDETAIHVLRILADLGLNVPDDVGVIGYDDVDLATRVTPRLTTLGLTMSPSKLGELAANMLLARIEGKGDDTPHLLKHDLIIRDSTP